ncbi:hypothetical protein CANARDRAFT_102193 [[Candida] arabinofermentans NRRL YB-2248]|uniref:Uncharacterized protein n=1 Tax=[Candida] arabinofermentans NRRL YB-2248 TaxID=983967 RepID=A0A1E4SUF2_9ASCO|nr:hypothetical protein CANARDRAFT_102193 [[Candida] arabinofermentans NRRL YB-2248]
MGLVGSPCRTLEERIIFVKITLLSCNKRAELSCIIRYIKFLWLSGKSKCSSNR